MLLFCECEQRDLLLFLSLYLPCFLIIDREREKAEAELDRLLHSDSKFDETTPIGSQIDMLLFLLFLRVTLRHFDSLYAAFFDQAVEKNE
ncbi:hypothetical protein BDQ94DRAFT_143345 [Aspergillus welwitschiae]|uniref:Uncharacterized protein n=1 Tax=Aspergillus welwitschiae TaxID=1341132 RepID=A0A3F3Q301_9EURO|nr:hypothetical protein BDQ94DRAFT_143345 [Aspergillus welwitschiae]RDH33570.1 hypothetical protein BDQ94DRAFT_143345 [Aspergillus welwitschiae]